MNNSWTGNSWVLIGQRCCCDYNDDSDDDADTIMLDTDDFSEIYKDDDIDYNDISPVLSTHNWSTEGEYWLDHLNWQIRFDIWMYLDIG